MVPETDESAASAGIQPTHSIAEAEAKWDATAKAQQHKTVRFTMAVTWLAPAAVILLGFQLILFPEDKIVGGCLIGLEFLLLLVVLFLGFAGADPDPKEWARSRIRAELLRREKFLLMAGLGPYLGLEDPAGEVQRRLRTIEMEERDPVKLLPLSDGRGHWRDQLEDSHKPHGSPSNLLPALRSYLTNRIEDQLTYYRGRSHENHTRHLKYERSMKIILALAWLSSGIHLACLLWGEKQSWENIITILSLVCPPITAAVAGVQGFFQPNRLRLAYVNQSESLTMLANELSLLEDKLVKEADQHEATAGAANFKAFKRIVLRAEEILATEQMQWWMLINSWTLSA